MSFSESEQGVRDVVNIERFSSFKAFVPFILYLPIGVILGLIRCLIFLHASLVFFLLPETFPFKRWILRVMLTVVGLPISAQGKPHLDSSKQIIIANHISNLDPLILTLLHSYQIVWAVETPNLMCVKNVSCKIQELSSAADHSETVKTVKRKIKDNAEPFLFFPEKVKSNGNGVLKFSLTAFESDCSIQPVLIQAKRFPFDINISTVSSSLIEDLLWVFLLPFTLFTIRYLPLTEKKKDETYEDFSKRVQTNMSKSLSRQNLPYSYTDVSLYLKERQIFKACQNKARNAANKENKTTQMASTVSKNATDDAQFEKMLMQVKDVLPDTPVDAIEAELKRTQDVDATITNILEGKVDTSTRKPEAQGKSLMSLSAESLLFKAQKFEQNAKDRQLSFSERKQAMLEAARLKYRIKHGL